MIIVGLGKAYHDSSICVFNNGKIKYAKYEREINIKHGYAPEQWYWKKLQQWNIDLDKIDLLVQTDEGALQFIDGTPRLPLHDQDVIHFTKNHYIIDHHLAHAYSHTSYSPTDQFYVMDGRGSNGNSISIKNKKNTFKYKETNPGHIFGAISRAMKLSSETITTHLLNEAGKVMGLIAHGKRKKDFYKISDLNELYTLCRCLYQENNQEWQDFIHTADKICFEWIKDKFKLLNKDEKIIYSGGCALNIEWNRLLLKEGYNLNLEPPVYDGGLSLGCIRWGLNYLNSLSSFYVHNFPYIQDDEKPLRSPTLSTTKKVAEMLSQNKIVGWYQDHGEIGPRALGNRSILMNPSLKDGKTIMNEKVKHREWWRPYGASIIEEKALEFFDLSFSPYMLYSTQVRSKDIPSVTHIDNSCRPQTVSCKQNKNFYNLLNEFEKLTGLPVLLNTSLNRGGKPIVGTINNAKDVLKNSEMDALCVGNELFYS